MPMCLKCLFTVPPINVHMRTKLLLYVFVHMLRYGMPYKPFLSLHNHQLIYYIIVFMRHKIPVSEILGVETVQSRSSEFLVLKLRNGSIRQILSI